MIQFVCMREGTTSPSGRGKNTSYRSLTADKIIIHPGSVMFRTDPQFIVAGEIIRTSRMYAMSVSPLSREIIEKLGAANGEWVTDDYGSAKKPKHKGDTEAGKERKLKKTHDFTNNIKIAGEIFEIKTIKGKKTVILPWEKLKTIHGKTVTDTVYKGLKGCVTVNGIHTVFAGEKLALILSLAPFLDMENALSRKWPRKKNFNYNEDLKALVGQLDSLIKPALWKKGSKEIGFLGLFTDNSRSNDLGGNYWLRCSRGFHTSLNESLASLEALIDETGDDVDIGIKHIVNQTYRRLSDYLNL